MTRAIDGIVARGEVGGRTVQIVETGAVECHVYEPAPLADGQVRVRTVRSAVSTGTEMTFYGRDASNVYLHKQWNEELRLFEPGTPSIDYPFVFGYRASGEVVESRSADVAVGHRVYGNWRHTELTTMSAQRALDHTLPADADLGRRRGPRPDGPDLRQRGRLRRGRARGWPCGRLRGGPVGLITAQIAAAEGAQVFVVDRVSERLQVARDLGLETVEAAEGVDVAATLKRRFGSEGIAVAWECTGSTFALHEAIRVVRRKGLVVAVGLLPGRGPRPAPGRRVPSQRDPRRLRPDRQHPRGLHVGHPPRADHRAGAGRQRQARDAASPDAAGGGGRRGVRRPGRSGRGPSDRLPVRRLGPHGPRRHSGLYVHSRGLTPLAWPSCPPSVDRRLGGSIRSGEITLGPLRRGRRLDCRPAM